MFAIHLQNLLLLPQWPRPISIFHGVVGCELAIMLNPLSFLPCHISSSTTSFLFHYNPIYMYREREKECSKRKLYERHKNVIGIFCSKGRHRIEHRLSSHSDIARNVENTVYESLPENNQKKRIQGRIVYDSLIENVFPIIGRFYSFSTNKKKKKIYHIKQIFLYIHINKLLKKKLFTFN